MPAGHSPSSFTAACRLTAALAATLLLLVGCSRQGELGRPHAFSALYDPNPKNDPITTAAIKDGGFPLTDDERQLRALAKNVLLPADADGEGGRFGSLRSSGVPIAVVGAQREHYAQYLAAGPFRSATARYSRLIDDTRDDTARLETFFQVARRVAEFDRRRERSIAHVQNLSAEDLLRARRRMRENMMLMEEVHRTLSARAETYGYTLERLVVAVPSPMAIDAERTRLDLQRRLAAIQVAGESGPAIASK